MAPTWKEWSSKIGADPFTSPHEAKWAIPAYAAYMRSLRRGWSGRSRTVYEQHPLAVASYNAGQGRIISAQKQCKDALLWPDIAACLESITGPRNANETKSYVARIYSVWQLMEEK
jgi:hypothetical protein